MIYKQLLPTLLLFPLTFIPFPIVPKNNEVQEPEFVDMGPEKDHNAEYIKMLDKAGEAIVRMCNIKWIAKQQAYLDNPELQKKQEDMFLNKVVETVDQAKRIAEIRTRVSKKSVLFAEGKPEDNGGYGMGGKYGDTPEKELLLDLTGFRDYNNEGYRYKKVVESLEKEK